ncbi:uncharacterized protein VTP21DRAFT_4245 [Calcarisporiella thermophila]|uniref:uncharacterized protein n=1 Tax=Calcarisporiella thermophila TaxID=911321 RepID=UPI0037440D00
MKVYAQYSYIADNADEISFHQGDIIEVLERDEHFGDGWWHGRTCQGHVGLFPANHTLLQSPKTTQCPGLNSHPKIASSIQLSRSFQNWSHYLEDIDGSYPGTNAMYSILTRKVRATLKREDLKFTSVESWSIDQVSKFFRYLHLDDTASSFEYHEITGDILLSIHTMEQLKELGLDIYGRRFKTMAAVRILQIESTHNSNSSSMLRAATKHQGWLHKQGDHYKVWNQRWCVLRGIDFYYMKSPCDINSSLHIDLRGCKIGVEDMNMHNFHIKTRGPANKIHYFQYEMRLNPGFL